MKKLLTIGLSLLLMLGQVQVSAFAATDDTMKKPVQVSNTYTNIYTGVEINKSWTIVMTNDIDYSSLTSETVYISNLRTWERVPTKLEPVQGNPKAFKIIPLKNYEYSTRYEIAIQNLKSAKGKKQKSSRILQSFSTKAKDVQPESPTTTTPSAITSLDKDTDGDGLSDYQETNKYLTDPNKADTDGDGKNDGEGDERLETTYYISAKMRVEKPYTYSVMNDDYQDVKLLNETDKYGEFQVTVFPLNKNKDAIQGNSNWKEVDKQLLGSDYEKYTKATTTQNYDSQMQQDLLVQLKAAGIDPETMDDKTLAKKVAKWNLDNSKFLNEFTTFFVKFDGNGKPYVPSNLQSVFDVNKGDWNWSTEEEFNHELFGKQMFYNKQHGSCTSSGIYWGTIYKALGIPTRTIVTVPVIDASNTKQYAMLDTAIGNEKIREHIKAGLNAAGNSFASHTYNEIFVGGRWVRANYDVIGQNVMDDYYFGLMVHVDTYNDISEINPSLADSWGLSYSKVHFESTNSINPYACLELKDTNGTASNADVPKSRPRFDTVTLDSLHWKDDPATPHKESLYPGEGFNKFPNTFYAYSGNPSNVLEGASSDDAFSTPMMKTKGDDFYLQADGQPIVNVITSRLQMTSQEYVASKPGILYMFMQFYIDDAEYSKMAPGIKYQLKIKDNSEAKGMWNIPSTLTITK